MKRRREEDIPANPFPFLSLLAELRGEVYGYLKLRAIASLARTNVLIYAETNGRIPVLPPYWRRCWNQVARDHTNLLPSLQRGMLDLFASGVADWVGIASQASVSSTLWAVTWTWGDGTRRTFWDLVWIFGTDKWELHYLHNGDRYPSERDFGRVSTFTVFPEETRKELQEFVAKERRAHIHTPW